MIEHREHRFRQHGSEEMICMACGFVIWSCTDEAGVARALEILGEEIVDMTCPKVWHGFTHKEG